ncbi:MULTISPECIES: hypothetical protein [Pectobacterium]|uniref:hypothetical protein n=1 Tax=Pectobacterium TaxID=122277 RepID=UPI0013F3B5DC|nr:MULTISPECIES: hypothetical protein [Pectobacterium]MCO4313289.1 hypothetical protein [Pectobacterium versatile]MDY4375770.1 hypothetical protein [Pectobacterium carotovorum subsp. carotovorum]
MLYPSSSLQGQLLIHNVRMPSGLAVIWRKKLCSGGRDRRVSGMDAAKASAASGTRHWWLD